jgi:hypothetical protein
LRRGHSALTTPSWFSQTEIEPAAPGFRPHWRAQFRKRNWPLVFLDVAVFREEVRELVLAA